MNDPNIHKTDESHQNDTRTHRNENQYKPKILKYFETNIEIKEGKTLSAILLKIVKAWILRKSSMNRTGTLKTMVTQLLAKKNDCSQHRKMK